MKIFSMLIAVAMFTACDGIVGADDDNFVFDSVRVTYTTGMTDNAEAFGLLRNLQVDGLIVLPHPCHNVGGDYSRVGGQITLTVTATSVNSTCTAELTAMQYRLQTFGLPRGPLRVRVYHRFGTNQRTLIAEQDIVVG